MARILLIDDNVQLCEMLKVLLTQSGFDVVEAVSFEAGVRIQRANPAELIVIDFNMPKTGGTEAIAQIKREFPSTKLIGISASFQKKTDQDSTLSDLLGVERTLSKPFPAEALVKVIRDVLAEQGSE